LIEADLIQKQSRSNFEETKRQNMSISQRAFGLMLLLLSTVTALAQGATVSLDISHAIATPGTNVTVTCRPKGISDSALVKFNKIITHELNELASETISTQTVLELPYKNLGRFAVSKMTDGNETVYLLHIFGVQTVDSGNYGCSATDGGDLLAVKQLDVYQVPQQVSFVNYNESGVIYLSEQNATDIECLASYVLPYPVVTVTSAGRDVTGDFLTASLINALCRDVGTMSKTCPLHYNLNVTATNRRFRPIYTDDGQKLVCRITMKEFNKDVTETSLIMSVTYAPKIVCQEQWVAVMNSTNVALHCLIYCNPPALIPDKTWIIGRYTSKEIRVQSPAQTNEFSITETIVSTNVVNATLTINVVSKQFFGDYYLEVSNSLGSVEKKLTLTLTSPPTSGAIKLWTSEISFLLAMALLLGGSA
jgi:hypothetical protein